MTARHRLARGAVTLTGVVSSDVERRTAEMIARSSLALSVTNELRLAREDEEVSSCVP
jgi:hypothetical protein